MIELWGGWITVLVIIMAAAIVLGIVLKSFRFR